MVRTLRDLIVERGPLPADVAVAMLDQVARWLGELHRGGRVHGGLQPTQVLIEHPDRAAEFITVTGIVAATGESSPGWAAPEQLGGGPITAATDVFTLGLLVPYAMSGCALFEAADRQAALSICEDHERYVGTVLSRLRLPSPVADVIWRACRWRPTSRFAGVEPLMAALWAAIDTTELSVTDDLHATADLPAIDVVLADMPTAKEHLPLDAAPREVRTVEAQRSAEVAFGDARFRVTFLDVESEPVRVHLKAMNCFLRRGDGPPTRALNLCDAAEIEVMRCDRAPVGTLRCDVGKSDGRARVFRINDQLLRAPGPAVLLDFGPGGEAQLIHRPSRAAGS